jgi:tripartite-type tricarboxylate transporter receptor subunit TctC
VEKVSADVATVLKMPDVRKRLMDIGLDPIGLSPQEFAELIRRDFEKWGRVIAKANIKIN